MIHRVQARVDWGHFKEAIPSFLSAEADIAFCFGFSFSFNGCCQVTKDSQVLQNFILHASTPIKCGGKFLHL